MQLGWIKVTAAGALSMCVDMPVAHASSARLIRGQYSGLGLPEHKSGQLSRHHDSDCYLVNTLDNPRCAGAILFGDPVY
jgi:hypothetical protein